jgi:ABC-type nitrate/sulfonate/bicarbonate transport system substrate-binding protein
VVSIAAVTTRLVLGVGARNDWMASRNLTPASPLEARVKALKGTRIGVATVGGGPAQYGRYLMQAYGLDPKADAQFLPVGQAATRIAALRENRVDVIIGAPPESEMVEAQGFGALLINLANEVPIFRDYAFTVVITSKEYAEKNADIVRRMARAVARGNGIVHSDFAAAVQTAQEAHANVEPAAVELAMKRFKDGTPNGAAQSETMWRNVVESMRATGAIQRDVPAAEGGMWTNRYLG